MQLRGAAKRKPLRGSGRSNLGLAGMVEQIDVWRMAKMVIDEHGEHASFVAATRADALLDKGDIAGQRVWLRILAAIRELQTGGGTPH